MGPCLPYVKLSSSATTVTAVSLLRHKKNEVFVIETLWIRSRFLVPPAMVSVVNGGEMFAL